MPKNGESNALAFKSRACFDCLRPLKSINNYENDSLCQRFLSRTQSLSLLYPECPSRSSYNTLGASSNLNFNMMKSENEIEDLEGDQVLRYFIVAATCLIFYEYLISFDNEIRYLWNRRISFGGVLLLLCRSFPFATSLAVQIFITGGSNSSCIIGLRAITCVVLVEASVAVLVLTTRAYAVWSGSMTVLGLLAVAYISTLGVGSYSVFLFLRAPESVLPFKTHGCIIENLSDILWIALIAYLSLEFLVLSLLLLKSILHRRRFNIIHRGVMRKGILSIMTQDGIGYFACTLVVAGANVNIIHHLSLEVQDGLLVLQGVIQNILCSRLIFHIRSVNDVPISTTQASSISWTVPSIELNSPEAIKVEDDHT
ncbi:hypothetical protein SCHPADRAFT_591383 [Schizopora paradoxa]|uniref:DUF6533 domain-containing protein n=1 Tax=Schizopora paradoxa TaxID=27342 RepID=A0A0H2RAM6_9AGAM|nr:hypothetical protein SCHPADRAFT_591383 [Schizopora paradoxa]